MASQCECPMAAFTLSFYETKMKEDVLELLKTDMFWILPDSL